MSNFYLVLLLEMGVTAGVLLGGVAVRHLQHTRTPERAEIAKSQPSSIPSRSFLRALLGSLWLLDGLLQAQPSMPGSFANRILAPIATGTPSWLAAVIHWEIGIWQAHPVHLAVATVLIQAGIGVSILAGGDTRLGRWGLWASVIWGALVWVLGEALGGLLAPGASLIAGAPGSVLAYVAAAGLLLAPAEIWRSGRVVRLIEVGIGATFLLGVLLQTIPEEGFWNSTGIGGLFAAMARAPQPGALSEPIRAFASLVAADPLLWNALLTSSMVVIGVAYCLGGGGRALAVATVVWLAFAWWFGQDFGAPGTGVTTDPNLAPLLVALLLTAEAPSGWVTGWADRLQIASRQQLLRGLAVAGLAAVLVGVVGGLPYLAQATMGNSSGVHVSASLN
jgi:hypothetical protein